MQANLGCPCPCPCPSRAQAHRPDPLPVGVGGACDVHSRDQVKGVCRSQQGLYHVTLSYSQAIGLSGTDPSQGALSKSEISLLAGRNELPLLQRSLGSPWRVTWQGPLAASGSRQPVRSRDFRPGCVETNCIFPRRTSLAPAAPGPHPGQARSREPC